MWGGAVQITLRDPGADRPGEPVLERSLMQPHWGQEQLSSRGVREQALVSAIGSEDALNKSRDDERGSPAPSFRHEYQEWVDEVELCFDRDTPKRGIDGVIELLAEVVEQERMGQPVGGLYRLVRGPDQRREKDERNKVWRINSEKAPNKKCLKRERSRSCVAQVDAESTDHEKYRDAHPPVGQGGRRPATIGSHRNCGTSHPREGCRSQRLHRARESRRPAGWRGRGNDPEM